MSGQQHAPAALPGEDPVPILQEAGWAPGPVWTGGKSCPHRDFVLSSLFIYDYGAVAHNCSLHNVSESMTKVRC